MACISCALSPPHVIGDRYFMCPLTVMFLISHSRVLLKVFVPLLSIISSADFFILVVPPTLPNFHFGNCSQPFLFGSSYSSFLVCLLLLRVSCTFFMKQFPRKFSHAFSFGSFPTCFSFGGFPADFLFFGLPIHFYVCFSHVPRICIFWWLFVFGSFILFYLIACPFLVSLSR